MVDGVNLGLNVWSKDFWFCFGSLLFSFFSLQASIRKANLASKAIIDKSEKDELLGGQASNIRNRFVRNNS